MGEPELVEQDAQGGAAKRPHHWAVWAQMGDESRKYWARGEWGPYASMWYRESIVEMDPGGTYRLKEKS